LFVCLFQCLVCLVVCSYPFMLFITDLFIRINLVFFFSHFWLERFHSPSPARFCNAYMLWPVRPKLSAPLTCLS
jgi:hypothetical protein